MALRARECHTNAGDKHATGRKLAMATVGGKFVQLTMEDSGRAEMPLVDKTNEERYPVGMALSSTTTNLLKKNENEKYPHPMPVLFLLSGDGLLCGFHALHDTHAASITNPPPGAPGQPRPGKIVIPAAVAPTHGNRCAKSINQLIL